MSFRTSLLSAVPRPLKRLARKQDGNVAIWFGLMLIPLVGVISIGVDVSRAYLVKSRLSYAIDSAALAGGGNIDAVTRDEDMKMFFDTNYPDGFLGSELVDFTIAVGDENDTVDVRATVDVPTTFARVLGFDTIRVGEENRVRLATRGMELALIMDNTGSMRSGGKIDVMKDAARDLVDILYGGEEMVPNLWVSLVPYAATVNVGNEYASWLQGYDPAAFAPTNWKGCVEARTSPLDESDATPASGPFSPHYWPSTLNVYSSTGDNDWNAGNIDESNGAQNNGLGPNLGCGPAITPLVAAQSVVDAAIDEMQPWHRGGTMANLGLAWGWRTLSPEWRGLWNSEPQLPLGYDDDITDKVAIILTDGVNQWYDWPGGLPGRPNNSTFPDADYTAYGRLSEGNLGTTNGGAATTAVNNRMLNLCQSMKDEGITVYTITFRLSNSSTRALYQQCATTPGHYFDSPSNAELSNVFTTIGYQLTNLRLER